MKPSPSASRWRHNGRVWLIDPETRNVTLELPDGTDYTIDFNYDTDIFNAILEELTTNGELL